MHPKVAPKCTIFGRAFCMQNLPRPLGRRKSTTKRHDKKIGVFLRKWFSLKLYRKLKRRLHWKSATTFARSQLGSQYRKRIKNPVARAASPKFSELLLRGARFARFLLILLFPAARLMRTVLSIVKPFICGANWFHADVILQK